ncbi:MAG: TIR domain-containing protein [Alphaproteobacteria bacterium]|nr:TIR domain-containing protein [Alphaproteobacteria bacterium]
MSESKYYDVALSFAGEDRAYVEQVAVALDAAGVHVFYDRLEEANLWGKDLYSYLDEIYRRKARYCIVFISEAYGQKLWTNHERESAQARAFEENEEYLLPARFDDTEIPGIRPTTGYIDLRQRMPEELAELVVKKIGAGARSAETEASAQNSSGIRRPKLRGRNPNPYDAALQFIQTFTGELKHRCDSLSNDGVSASLFERGGRQCLRVVLDGETKYSLDVWLGGIAGGDEQITFYGGAGRLSVGSNSSNGWGTVEWDRDTESSVLNYFDVSLLSFGGIRDQKYEFEEFTDAVWEKICDALEVS